MSLNDHDKKKLIGLLKTRFEQNMTRHEGLVWSKVQDRLDGKNQKLWSLSEMERTGGEPDVLLFNENSNEYTFYDCAIESPKGRRSLCYDREALETRKEYKPENSALDMASQMGVNILNEEQYRFLQSFGNFDCKTSSWLATPASIRNLGGAIFGDFRYDTIFIYHNGAQSYYAARGFRAFLNI